MTGYVKIKRSRLFAGWGLNKNIAEVASNLKSRRLDNGENIKCWIEEKMCIAIVNTEYGNACLI